MLLQDCIRFIGLSGHFQDTFGQQIPPPPCDFFINCTFLYIKKKITSVIDRNLLTICKDICSILFEKITTSAIGLLAQLVERQTDNLRVMSSIPDIDALLVFFSLI